MMKENIESLLEGTSIPKYLTLFYAVMIIVISSILSVGFYQDLHQQKQRFSAVIDTNYHVKIDPDTADSIVCYQHRLHYRNLTFFSGYLPFEGTTCRPKVFNAIPEKIAMDSSQKYFGLALSCVILFLFFSVFWIFDETMKV
jgi:hypothetical protein